MKLPIDILTEKSHRIYKESDGIHCPGCGAPVSSDRCEYCGSYFVDYGCMDADQPFWIKIKKDGLIYMFPVCLTESRVLIEEAEVIYRDNTPYSYGFNRQLELTFDIMRDD